jgi:hypothetical protein
MTGAVPNYSYTCKFILPVYLFTTKVVVRKTNV